MVGSYPRDANRVPITQNGTLITKTVTLTGNNTTVVTPLFRCVGSVLINALYGVVTTTLGSNHTAAYWRLNDQSAQVNITLNTGTALSSAPANSLIVKKGLNTAALALISSAAGAVSEPTTLETMYFSPFVMVDKTGAVNTDIEYVYTTTNTPTSGVIQFYCGYVPLSVDGDLTAL